MPSLLDFPLLAFDVRPWLADMILILVKGTLLLSAAGLLTYALRHSAAATRYMVWCSALLGLFLLPFLSPLMPAWQVAVLPASIEVDQALRVDPFNAQPAPLPDAVRSLDPLPAPAPLTLPPATAPADASLAANWSAMSSSLNWMQWAFLVWALGVCVVLGRLALAHAGARLLVSRASHVDDEEWHLKAESAAHRLGVQRLVRLRMSTWTSVPMAVGVWRPVIVLPADADTWSDARKDAVLLHELAHVKRYDCLFQLMTNVVTAIYWFNPLVWLASWQMRIERERSADDIVIVSGADASHYAETLLETARMLRRGEWSTVAAVSMARGSQLEGRLLSILDPFRRRNQNRPATWLTLMLVACIVVPLAALQPVATMAQATPRPPRAPRVATPPAPIEIEIPDMDIEVPAITIPEIDVEIPEIHVDVPAFHFVMPAIKIPAFDVDIPEMVIEIPEMNFEVPEFEWDEEQAYPQTPVDSLTIEQIIRLRQYGVDTEFIQSLKRMGFGDLTYQDLVMLGRYGADADFITEMKESGYTDLTLGDYATMSKYGVDVDFVRTMREAGYTDLSGEELVTMSKYGVDQDLVEALGRYGYQDLTADMLINASKYGVDTDLLDNLREQGYTDISLDDVITMTKYGVDSDYLIDMKEAGLDLPLDELIRLQRHGVDADYVREIRDAGLKDVTVEQLIDMHNHGVDGAYIKALRDNE
ncbi:MAG: M56 family metallopeptidase [Rhodothermales bacterium]|nr:M56 family metallopeptidase [Rhodothermales bacterium]